MKQEDIIAPVDKELLKAELTEACFLRDTNHADNKLYIVDNQSAPHVLQEIGRLREIAFRAAVWTAWSSPRILCRSSIAVNFVRF